MSVAHRARSACAAVRIARSAASFQNVIVYMCVLSIEKPPEGGGLMWNNECAIPCYEFFYSRTGTRPSVVAASQQAVQDLE